MFKDPELKWFYKVLKDKNAPTDLKNRISLYYLKEAKNRKFNIELAYTTKHCRIKKAKRLLNKNYPDGDNELYFEELSIYYAISLFNLSSLPLKNRTKELNDLVKNKIIKSFTATTEKAVITRLDGSVVEVKTLSKMLDDMFDVETLSTTKRLGKCHRKTIALCNYFDQIGMFSNIVTGLVKDGHEDGDVLHTWSEFEQKGIEYVADYTINAVMPKKDYYKLRHITKPLCVINSQELFKTFNLKQINSISDSIDEKVFLTNYHKIKPDLLKNNFGKVPEKQK